ncbi:MAG: magnesium/cobalt transporter CorA [Chitinivibrionia bacterium]|nr:magnesium/cobalt transporter CorA [Chitinivibrionia bacterium]
MSDKFTENMSEKIGEMPEDIVFIGEKKVEQLSIEVIEYYRNGNVKDFKIENIREILPLNNDCITWINITGVHDGEHIKEIGALLELHPLIVEDILNTTQHPKMQDYGDCIFFITKMLYYYGGEITSEQVSLVLSDNYVLSFKESKEDIFKHVRQKIHRKKGRNFKSGADYLAYQLIDAVVENYIGITEQISDKIEDLEDAIDGKDLRQDSIDELGNLKRILNRLRKTVRPTNDFIVHINTLDTDLIKDETEPFFHNLLDISARANSAIESCRDMLADNLQIYNLSVANRFNDTLRMLTAFSLLFIPITFIASLYGMNFEHIPELKWEYGYFVVLGVMLAISVGMMVYFRRRKWM